MSRRVKKATYPDVLWVQAVLAPRRRDAAVEVGPGASHVQLVLVGLGGDIVSHVGAGKEELEKIHKQGLSRLQHEVSDRVCGFVSLLRTKPWVDSRLRLKSSILG